MSMPDQQPALSGSADAKALTTDEQAIKTLMEPGNGNIKITNNLKTAKDLTDDQTREFLDVYFQMNKMTTELSRQLEKKNIAQEKCAEYLKVFEKFIRFLFKISAPSFEVGVLTDEKNQEVPENFHELKLLAQNKPIQAFSLLIVPANLAKFTVLLAQPKDLQEFFYALSCVSSRSHSEPSIIHVELASLLFKTLEDVIGFLDKSSKFIRKWNCFNKEPNGLYAATIFLQIENQCEITKKFDEIHLEAKKTELIDIAKRFGQLLTAKECPLFADAQVSIVPARTRFCCLPS